MFLLHSQSSLMAARRDNFKTDHISLQYGLELGMSW